MENESKTKRCKACKQIKELQEFYKDKSRSDGYDNRCKECDRKRNSKPERKKSRLVSKQKRKAMKLALPNELTTEEWNAILESFGSKCVLTGKVENVEMEHFIPLSIGHGGTCKGNVYPMLKSLNGSKGNKNPLKWIQKQPHDLQIKFHRVLLPYLAQQNGMDVKTFKKYVNWCFKNKRKLKQVQTDNEKGLTSLGMFWEEIK